MDKIPVGISSCLLGNEVRFDGGHKHDRYVTGTLGKYFDFKPICPEVEIGMSIPRPPIQLARDLSAPRLIGVKDKSLDFTDDMLAFANANVDACASLCGYLFKRGSPSCGMERIRVYPPGDGAPLGTASGLFARVLMDALPLMPCEDEGRLNDPPLRENFVTRVFAFHRWRTMRKVGVTPASLIAFHTQHKYLLLAHSEVHYRRLGPMLATAGRDDIESLADHYVAEFMAGLNQRATRRTHANVLQHVLGFLKRNIDAGDKAELVQTISDYRAEKIPLVVPLALLKHHFRRNPDPFISLQYYLNPYPDDLGLRNAL
ncbi:MAG: DUF523 and DUF1722 domain-containing protein [Pseudomonadota bacterium]